MTLSEESERFVFCCDVDCPSDLIMLENKEQIVKLMFQQQHKTFVWVTSDSCKLVMSPEIQNLEMDTYFCSSLTQAFTYISKNNSSKQHRQFLLIGCYQIFQQFEPIFRNEQVITMICYDTSQRQYHLYLKLQELYEEKGKKLFLAEDQQQLISLLESLNKRSTDFKMFPNFISMQDDVWNSNILIRTMFSMLNQRLSQSFRKKLIDHLRNLFAEICKQNSYFEVNQSVVNNFMEEMLKGPLPVNRAIYWFSLQSPIFKFTNNLLRVARHPAQIYYIQPFFKDLFNSVGSLNLQQKLKCGNQSLICYRGGLMQNSQIDFFLNSVGHTIQNLGFLSTSLNRDMALEYAINVVFTITVPNFADRPDVEYAYAWIANYSQYFSEEEILFNPLNSFRIIEVSELYNKGSRKIQIKLEYGAISSIINNPFESLSENDKWLSLLFKQQKKEMAKMRNQADTFLIKSQDLDGGLQLFHKIIQLSPKNKRVMIQVRIMLAKCLIIQGQFQLAIEEFEECSSLMSSCTQLSKDVILQSTIQMHFCHVYSKMGNYARAISFQENLRDLINLREDSQQKEELCNQWLLYIGESYDWAGFYSKSDKIYQEIEKRMLKSYGKYHPEYIRLMFKIASSNNSMLEYGKVFNYYEQYAITALKIKGERSIEYINVLFKTALIYKNTNELAQAEGLLYRCLNILSDLKSDSVLLYEVLLHLGVVSCSLGKVVSAIYFCKKSLQGFGTKLGRQNQNYAAALNGIGITNQRLNNFKEAHIYFEASLKIFMTKKDSKSIYAAMLYLDIGKNYAFQKKYKEALQIFLKSEHQFERCERIESRQFAFLLQLIAAAHYYNSNFKKSQQYFKRSLDLYSRIDGSNHINFGKTFFRMVPLLVDMADDEQKIIDLISQSDLYAKLLPHQNAHKANILQKISVLYRHRGDHLKNMKMIIQAISLYCSNSLKQEQAFLFMQIEKALSHHYNEQYEEAKSILNKANRVYNTQSDQVTVDTKFNRDRTRIYLERTLNKISAKTKKQIRYQNVNYIDFG